MRPGFSFKKALMAILSLLGFSFLVTSCYGAPTADYTFKGKVSDEDGKPIPGIKVSIGSKVYGEQATTGSDGGFEAAYRDFFPSDGVMFYYEDVDGPDNGGEFRSDSTKVELIQTKKGRGRWDMGKYEASDDKILKKK